MWDETQGMWDMDDTRTDSTIVDETLADAGIIPFADDEASRREGAGPSTRPAQGPRPDRVADALGETIERISVVDRELGLEDLGVPAREGRYECPCCGMAATRVVRVRIVHHAGWAAVCAVCAASLLEKLPGTIVGGAVKPSRKRRMGRIRGVGDRAGAEKKGRGGGQTPHGFRGDAADGLLQAG